MARSRRKMKFEDHEDVTEKAWMSGYENGLAIGREVFARHLERLLLGQDPEQ